jgi:chemotaxis protein MotB
MKKIVLYSVFVSLIACVPARKYEELKSKQEKCAEENAALKSSVQTLEDKNNELEAQIEKITKELKNLRHDTLVQGKSLRLMTSNYDQLNKTYQLLLEKNRELLAENQKVTGKLSSDLLKTQQELQAKEDALRALEASLNEKEKHLNQLQTELQQREKRIVELENILAKKDSAVNAIRAKVEDALLGFKNDGLTISKRNGKIYVSMEEKLLFPSGSYKIDKNGVKALNKLAKVLEENKDINITVEGHTDNVPYKGSGPIADNWDLSVKRATSVVKILTQNKGIAPKRITAAGRGEYDPIADNSTKEGRAKNRRIEIILTPKMDELFQILEGK